MRDDDDDGDLVAAVEFVVDDPRVDVTRIGLMGSSQAGWILPMVATRSPHVSFVVIRSGPTVTVAQHNYWDQIADDESLTIDQLSAMLEDFELGPGDFDPRPFLEKMTMPSLWLFGRQDRIIPAPRSAQIVEEIAAERTSWVESVTPGQPLEHLDLAGVVGVVQDNPGNQVRVGRPSGPASDLVQPLGIESRHGIDQAGVALLHEAAVPLPRRGRGPVGYMGPVRGRARESSPLLTRDPPSYRVVPVGHVKRQRPDAVPVGVGPPHRHVGGEAPKGAQDRGTAVPEPLPGGGVQVSQSLVESSVVHGVTSSLSAPGDGSGAASSQIMVAEFSAPGHHDVGSARAGVHESRAADLLCPLPDHIPLGTRGFR